MLILLASRKQLETLVIGSIMLLLIPCKNIWKSSKILSTTGIILVLFYIGVITFMVWMDAGHLFGLPIHEQFRVSVQDVLSEAKELGMSYQEANLQIFVYTPVCIIAFNLILLIISLFLARLFNWWIDK